jgi:repressor LexA
MDKPKPLTPPQRAVLEEIERYELVKGTAPTVRELGATLRRQPGAIHAAIEHLEAKGWIERVPGRRGLRVLHGVLPRESKKRSANQRVLLAGKIAAGEPIEALEEGQEWIEVPEEWVRKRPCYFLRVVGQSMEELIYDGDLVLVARETEFISGKVYVCVLPDDNEATLKYVHKERGGYRLVPANPQYAERSVKKLELRGRVVKIIRDFE